MKLPKLPWTVEHSGRNVTTIRVEVTGGTKWEQWALLRTDAHHDNPKCNWNLERKHLEQAKERNAIIIDNGDLFCAMQGKWDKRADKSSIRPEHQEGNYLDLLVKTAADFYQPYSHLWAVFGLGNHETAIIKAHETNLTERLVERLKTNGTCPGMAGGYGGWVRFMFKSSTRCDSRILKHYHGSGGGGAVTKGVIDTNRLATFTPDAQIFFTGHSHDEWIFPITRERLSHKGDVYHDEQLHLRAGGYKDAWADGAMGFEVEKRHGPKPNGAMWLIFTQEFKGKGAWQVNVEARRAK